MKLYKISSFEAFKLLKVMNCKNKNDYVDTYINGNRTGDRKYDLRQEGVSKHDVNVE